MARVQLGMSITDISGKVGGTVFQNTQGGTIMRNQPGIKNTFTSSRQRVKNGMQYIQQSWRELTLDKIAVWNAYAIFLNKSQHHNLNRIIGGQHLFIFQNQQRYACKSFIPSLAPVVITDPVIQPDPDQILITSVTNTAGTITVLLSRALSASGFVILKMSQPLRASQTSGYNKKNIIQANLIGIGDTFDITTAYTAIYGRVPSTGSYVNCSIALGLVDSNGMSVTAEQRITVD